MAHITTALASLPLWLASIRITVGPAARPTRVLYTVTNASHIEALDSFQGGVESEDHTSSFIEA